MDVLNAEAWLGRTQTQKRRITDILARQIHATVSKPGSPVPSVGDPMPPLWHWCVFTPDVHLTELSPDGHPRLGDFLPPLRLLRRMWAGGALSFEAPIRIGDMLSCTSTVTGIDSKGTSEKPMVFVTVEHEVTGPQGIAVRERQTIVYLDIPETFTPPKKRAMPTDTVACDTVAVAEPMLFRFSAVTFNAHRIHYDLPYTQSTEKYPGLVIHGPLQAMLLMQLATATKGAAPRMFEFRGVHPMFLGADLELAATEAEDGGLDLICGQSGHQGTVAHAIWEGTV